MKGISILGSTGSIGEQTLDIVRLHPYRFRVDALAAGCNLDRLEEQVREFRPSLVSVADENAARELKARIADLPLRPRIGHAGEGLESAATAEACELVVVGLPGSTGLVPTFSAVDAGKDVALATKEVLVMAGSLFMQTVQDYGVRLLPVDSEQSAIFQCLQGNSDAQVRRIILTASGGPFRDMPASDMNRVTREQALDHPRWRMGPKVTIDSATLMNKGFEIIEAQWLFDVPASAIEVVIHPQSIVHSMVEFNDGSIMAQLGATDMRIPISYALAFPERIGSGTESLSFPALASLTFHAPDFERFPLLKAAAEVVKDGATAPCIILNAADEVAVELFLAGRLSFSDIPRVVLDSLDRVVPGPTSTLEEIVDFHEQVVREVRSRWA
jgi:1-deoxy-D-xylulose-5-phosphate reductoisomerase